MTYSAIPKSVWDLSVPVADGVDWYYEEDCPPVQLGNVGSLAEDGWVSHTLSLMVLNGTTYLETAAHIRQGAPTLDQIHPEHFIVRAFVVSVVTQDRLLPAPDRLLPDFIPEADAILISCGWDASRVYAGRRITTSTVPTSRRTCSNGCSSIVPPFWAETCSRSTILRTRQCPSSTLFFATGGMILCPLMGLADLPPVVTLCAAPVNLADANAAPCRALAWT